jgi:hypothetical protein
MTKINSKSVAPETEHDPIFSETNDLAVATPTQPAAVGGSEVVVNAQKVADTIKQIGEEEEFDTEWATPKAVGWQLRALRSMKGRDTTSRKGDKNRRLSREAFINLCLAYGVLSARPKNSDDGDYPDPTIKRSETSEWSGMIDENDAQGTIPTGPPDPLIPETGGAYAAAPSPEETSETEFIVEPKKAVVDAKDVNLPNVDVPLTMDQVQEKAAAYRSAQRLYLDTETYVVDPTLSTNKEKPAVGPHAAAIRLLTITTETGAPPYSISTPSRRRKCWLNLRTFWKAVRSRWSITSFTTCAACSSWAFACTPFTTR